MKKKMIMLLMALLISAGFFGINAKEAEAASNIAVGTCGPKLDWWLTQEGVLYIEGEGAMDHWDFGDYPSWYSYNDQIEKVVVKKGVTEIGIVAFCDVNDPDNLGYRNLKSVSLPNTITRIRSNAFDECVNLETINFPSSLKYIDYAAFQECKSLKKVTFPSGLKEIGRCSFQESGLTSVIIPASVQKTSEDDTHSSFENCDSLVTATINGTGVEFEDFLDCDNLETVKMGSKVKFIGRNAFEGCEKLKNITIGSNVKYIQGDAFSGCVSLEEIFIPHSVEELGRENGGHGAFENCTSLKKIVIGTGMKSIYDNSFRGSTSIKEIYFCGDLPEFLGTETFPGVVATAYYPRGNKTWKPSKLSNQGGQIDWVEWDVPITYSKPVINSIINKSNGIKITWEKVAKADGYYLYRKAADGEWSSPIKVSGTTYTDKKATVNGRKYQYKIKAYDGDVTSSVSAVKTKYYVKRTAPKTLTTQSGGKITVKWEKNSVASGYQIRYSKKSDFSSYTTKSVGKSITSKKLTGLKKSTKYYVKMRAYKTVNGVKHYSAWSSVKSIKTKK